MRYPAPLNDRINNVVVDEASGCWNWQGYITPKGYGRLSVNGHPRHAHRVAYEFFCGMVPDGLQLDHTCCNKACINPKHLEAVTLRENRQRAARVRRTTTCKHGHLWTSESTYNKPDGYRNCRTCARLASLRYYQKNRKL